MYVFRKNLLILLALGIVSCLDKLPSTGSDNFCPTSRKESGLCSGVADSSTSTLGWDFSNSSDYIFNSNFVEVSSGRAVLKEIDTNYSANDFSSGSHIGTSVTGSKLSLLTSPTEESTNISSILSDRSSNLIGYWRFDGNFNDDSSLGNIGNVVGDANASGDPRLGTASAGFDGSGDSISFSNIGAMNKPTMLSACAWIYHSAIDDDNYILANSSNSGGILFLRDEVGGGTSRTDMYKIFVKEATDSDTAYIESSTASSLLETWTHVCFTFKANHSSGLHLYINGVEDSNSPVSTIGISYLDSEANALVVGNSLSGTKGLSGFIDELALWNTQLSSAEVYSIYQSQNASFSELSDSWAPNWSDIVGYWKLERNWQDSSGNAKHSVALNGASFSSDAKVGNAAALFDGSDDHLAIPAIDLGNSFTISGWFNSSGGTGTIQTILSNTGNSTNSNGFKILFNRFNTNDRSIGFEYGNGSVGANKYSSPNVVVFNDWNHIAVVADKNLSSIKIYVNGLLKIDDTLSVSNFSTSGVINIGQMTSNDYNFKGSIDDLSIWSSKLSHMEIKEVFERQKQKYAGSYNSPVIDLEFERNIKQILPTSDLPFKKELSSNIESSDDYSLLTGDLSSGLVAYWTLNEMSLGQLSGADFEDKSQNSNHINAVNNIGLGENGVLSKGISFDGQNSYVNLGNNSAIKRNFPITVSLWVNPNDLQNGTLIFRSDVWRCTNNPIYSGYGISTSSSGRIGAAIGTSSSSGCSADQRRSHSTNNSDLLKKGYWSHIVVVYRSETNVSIYHNGQIQSYSSSGSGGSLAYTSGNGSLGRYLSSSGNVYFNGKMDEVAIWSRELDASEVIQLYRRGANRIKYQVRICSDSTCSGDPEWQGPGGDGTTYFSELYNRSSAEIASMFSACDANGDNICSLNEFSVSGATQANPYKFDFKNSLVNNYSALSARYVQYRVIMEAEENTACEGEACLPSLSSIRLEVENDYNNFTPSVTSTNPITISGEIAKVEETATVGCNLKYQFSKDGTNFYYNSSGSWITAADNVAQANTISEVSPTLKDFISSGSLYVRAYLTNNGSQSCQLQDLSVTQQ